MKININGMKKILLAISFFSFLGFGSLSAQMPPEWPDEYVGTWKLTNSQGEIRYINLFKDHTATTTFNPQADGKWQYDADQKESRINWSDDWTDILLKKGDVYKNYGYGPSANPDDKPTNEFEAVKVGLDPYKYVGVWQMTDIKGNETEFTVNIDSSADKQGTKGKWVIVGDTFEITWPDGSKDVITKKGTSYKVLSFAPGAPVDGDPRSAADAKKIKAFLRSDLKATEINEESSD